MSARSTRWRLKGKVSVWGGLAILLASRSAPAQTTDYALIPTSDVGRNAVVGVPDDTALFSDVDDGPSFGSADDNTSYVRGQAGITVTSHSVGFSGAPAGKVIKVTAQVRASQGTASSGSLQLRLYDGETLLGTGAVHALGAWANFGSDTFDGLQVASANTLRLTVEFKNGGGSGAVRYTQAWLTASLLGGDGGTVCTPLSCATAHASCGSVADGCGAQLTCGGCVPPALCGVGGPPNVCTTPSERPQRLAAGGNLVCAPGQLRSAATCRSDQTLSLVAGGNFDAVLTLGNHQDPDGALAGFQVAFEPGFGALGPLLHPVPGNHDYRSRGAGGYFAYFGAAAGVAGLGYYSFELGSWHVIALNSNCHEVACGRGSAQEQWLKGDLAAHPAACTLAFWHHPLFSSGDYGSNAAVLPLFEDLYAANVDVVLAGHDRDYERFAPLNPAGNVDNARGIQTFVVGTGGQQLGTFPHAALTGSQARARNTFGMLSLTLRPGAYDWAFLPTEGGTYHDSGAAPCH